MVDKSPFDSQSNPNDESDDVSSLEDRAAKAARAELRRERTGILGAVGPSPLAHLRRERRVPEDWSVLHVMDRLEEAFRTLRRLPTWTGPRGYRNSMPHYDYDRADLNSQLETLEIERNEAGHFKGQAAAMLARKKFGRETEARKHYEAGRLPPAHIHARAKRYAVKLFLSGYFEVGYELLHGKKPPLPYPIAILGHAHKIEPPMLKKAV